MYLTGLITTTVLLGSLWVTLLLVILTYGIYCYVNDQKYVPPAFLKRLPWRGSYFDSVDETFGSMYIYLFISIICALLWPLLYLTLLVVFLLRSLRFVVRIKKNFGVVNKVLHYHQAGKTKPTTTPFYHHETHPLDKGVEGMDDDEKKD